MKKTVLSLACVLAWSSAFAAHPPEHMELHKKFYSTWMMPDNRNVSCCDDRDCYPTEARLVNGQWEAKRREDGFWMKIPAQKVETERDNPDGRSHVCALQPSQWFPNDVTVYCFIPGGGA
jgi:hypothetical protein